MSIDKFASR
jgi:hypothetical protein